MFTLEPLEPLRPFETLTPDGAGPSSEQVRSSSARLSVLRMAESNITTSAGGAAKLSTSSSSEISTNCMHANGVKMWLRNVLVSIIDMKYSDIQLSLGLG